jgi:hypothetical protein
MPVVRTHLTEHAQRLVELCQTLHDACVLTVHDGLKKGGPYASSRHVNLLLDCAAITDVTKDFLLRNSELHEAVAEACALICQACAKTCTHAADEELVALCRRCAAACRPDSTASS